MSAQRLEDCRRGLPEQLVEGERESLGKWLQKERSYSHNVSKNELLKEFFALLVARAERCMVRVCRNEKLTVPCRERPTLHHISKYSASYVEKLIQWLGAAYLS